MPGADPRDLRDLPAPLDPPPDEPGPPTVPGPDDDRPGWRTPWRFSGAGFTSETDDSDARGRAGAANGDGPGARARGGQAAERTSWTPLTQEADPAASAGPIAQGGQGSDAPASGEPTAVTTPTSPERSRLGTRAFSALSLGRGRPPTGTDTAAVNLGDLLLTARERKGVDLYRAERDTKIRARYLAALERGDYAELPGTVYTKGFLRNYAFYLGLDPDVVVAQYHREHRAARTERAAIVPRSLEAPRSGFTFTPGLVVGVVLVIAVLAFAGFIVLQLFRFSRPPSLVVTEPATLVVEMPGVDRTVLVGTSDPGATIAIRGPGGQPVRVSADSSGHWQKEVALNKGRNDFTITATDPVTAKDSPPVSLIISVPIPVSQAPTLTVSSPNKDAEFENGAVPIQGTTTAPSVTVAAKYTGPAATPAPGNAAPETPARPRAKSIKVGSDGSFSDSYPLAPGRWTLTIRATGDDEKTTTETRAITVSYTGVSLVVEVRGTKAWIKVWADGKIDPEFGEGGQTLPAGTTLEFNARKSVEIRTGSAGATYFTVNGEPVGALGGTGETGTWLFAPPAAPKKTSRE